MRKDPAQGISNLGKCCTRRRSSRNQVEQCEVVDGPQIPGGNHRNARCHQLVGIGFTLVSHDITLAGDDEGWRQSPELFERCSQR